MPIEYYSPVSGGAIATIIMQTTRELIAKGHQVTVLTPMNGDPVYHVGRVVPLVTKSRDDLSFIRRRLSGLRQRWHRWDWPYFEHYLRSLKRALAELNPPPDAVVLFNDLYTPPAIRSVVRKARIAVWLQNECRTDPANVARTIATTDIFLTCSESIRKWTIQTHAAPPDKIAVVHSGVDLDSFFPRSDYLVPRTPVRVLFLGRIDPNKGPDIVANAIEKLQLEGAKVELTIAGGLWFYASRDPMSDPFYRELCAKVNAVGGKFLGHVVRSDVPHLIRQNDIACVLSRSKEPFGLVSLEAMASGCAVVASNRGGLPEACGGAALLVDPDDFPSVVNALCSLVSDPQLLAEHKRLSVARASHASWSAVADRLEQVLANCGLVSPAPSTLEVVA